MKKLINLIALVMLVSVNILTPFSYADVEDFVDNVENIENEVRDVGEYEEKTSLIDEVLNDNEQEVLNGENEILENFQILAPGNVLDEVEQKDEEILEDNTSTKDLYLTQMENPIQLYRDGEVISTYTGLSEAINEAENGDVIKLIDDISVDEASIVSGKTLTINGNNYTITRDADITTITVNEDSSLTLQDITITDNAVKFSPNRYDALLKAKYQIALCLGGVNEIRDESGEVTESVCVTENVDTAKTHPQIYSVGNIYGDNLTISNSLNSNGSAAIIVERGGIEMVNSNFIHNGASGAGDGGRGGAIRVGPNSAINIVDQSPITKILFSGCYFENNYGRTYGGAIVIHYAPELTTIDNCIFSGNTAYMNGGAIHIPNIWDNPTGYLPAIFTGSTFPIGTLHVNNSEFYNNWCGNDGAAVENDDLHLQINSSSFEYNYGTQPKNQSVGVISCQAGFNLNAEKGLRGLIWREYYINNSSFKDTNTSVLGDHNMIGAFYVDSCSFENQGQVILTRISKGEIKNSFIKNSNPFGNCGETGYLVRDISIATTNYYPFRVGYLGESTFKLENNTYVNDCATNEYFHVRSLNVTTGKNNVIIENEANTKIFVDRLYYDSSNIQGTDEIYHGVTIDDEKYAYIKKNKFYNFDEFNTGLENFSYGNSGYQLEQGKTMLFYLDNGYTELWSGSISTTTNLYGKETDIYNIAYEGMEGIDFEGITHTYKFNNLGHTQYITELTPYTLNEPSRNGYMFEGRFLDTGYVVPVTSIETGSTGDITLYAKWEKVENKPSGSNYSGGGGGGTASNANGSVENKDSSGKDDGTQPQNQTENEQKNQEKNSVSDTENSKNNSIRGGSANVPKVSVDINKYNSDYGQEENEAYQFAYQNGITTIDSIKSAKMDGKLTRIQMAKMLSYYAMNVLGQEPDLSRGTVFKDVSKKLDREYNNAVTLAYQLGIMGINMPNNEFRPFDLVPRAEFVTALSRMIYDDVPDGLNAKFYEPHMVKLYNEGIISNTNPKLLEHRGYVMLMLMRSTK